MANKKMNPSDFEEKDSTWESFVEIITSCIKIGIFCGCVYIFKEIFCLVQDLLYIINGESADIINLVILPIVILLILAGCAMIFLRKL